MENASRLHSKIATALIVDDKQLARNLIKTYICSLFTRVPEFEEYESVDSLRERFHRSGYHRAAILFANRNIELTPD